MKDRRGGEGKSPKVLKTCAVTPCAEGLENGLTLARVRGVTTNISLKYPSSIRLEDNLLINIYKLCLADRVD